MKKRYVISIITVLLITISFFAYNKYSKKEEIIDNKTIGIMLEDSYQSDTYSLSTLRSIPIENYTFNATKTNELCNGATFSYDDINNRIIISTYKSIKCNLYFNMDYRIVPIGYTQLEYLGFTGTQYIDTELDGGTLYKESGTFILPTTPTTRVALSGAITSSPDNRNILYFTFWNPVTEASFISDYTGQIKVDTLHAVATVKNTVLVGIKYNIYVDMTDYPIVAQLNGPNISWGQYNYKNHYSSLPSGVHVGLGALIENNSNISNYFVGRIYEFEFEGVAHFIPVRRNSDDTLGMYDIVRNRFFTNAASTGDDFEPGPEV